MAEPKYVKWICGKCNYKFSRKEDSPVALRCPYCGSKNLAEDRFDINQAIAEVDEL
jgi:DNA-directed RNA polymerase subunit RPC12/RpoP